MLRFGGIVGHARLVDVVPPCGGAGGRCHCKAALSFGRSWHMPEQFGFVLEDVVPLPFRPCKGHLGFFEFKEVGMKKRVVVPLLRSRYPFAARRAHASDTGKGLPQRSLSCLSGMDDRDRRIRDVCYRPSGWLSVRNQS